MLSKEEQKKWILKRMPVSSGKRITEMLNRYWKTDKNGGDIIATAKQIFDI